MKALTGLGVDVGSFAEVYYHFVWATRRREWFLNDTIEPIVHDYIRHVCASLDITVYAVNGMADHVHLACSLPLSLSPSSMLNKLKGASSHYINHLPEVKADLLMCLYWQPGAGVLTFAARDLIHIVRYVDNQKQHHANNQLSPKMEHCDDINRSQ